MAHKISGTTNSLARVLILDQSDWSITSNGLVSSAYDIFTTSGSKTVIAREHTSGRVVGWSNIAPVEKVTVGLTSEIARYDFEPGYLTVDSVGTNTLETNGSIVSNIADYKQGAGSADFESSTGPNFYRVMDSNLSSDFPFKNGVNQRNMSICGWFKPESFSENAYVVSKFNTGKRQFVLQIRTTGEVRFYVASSDQSLDYVAFGTNLTAGRWYHIGVAYTASTKAAKIRIWDGTAGTLLNVNATKTLTTTSYDTDGNFHIATREYGDGGSENYDGLIDKLSIFAKFLTDDEIDAHRTTSNNDLLSITFPVPYQIQQRDISNRADITISGTYVGSPDYIEASFNGGTFSVIDNAPSNGFFHGILTNQLIGDGDIIVRFFNNDGIVTDTVSNIRIGDIYMVIGQSNAEGRGLTLNTYSGINHGASQFDESGNWEPLSDSNGFLGPNGSVYPILATLINNSESIPIGFIGYTAGGTGFYNGNWSEGGVAYLAAVNQFENSRINGIKAFLWYQGETDAYNNFSTVNYQTALSNMVDALHIELGTSAPLVAALIGEYVGVADSRIDAIRTAIINRWDNDSNILPGPVAHDQNFTDDLHWKTNTEILTLAQRWYRSLEYHFYSGSQSPRGPIVSSIEKVGARLLNVNFMGGYGSLTNSTNIEGWVVVDNGSAVGIESVSILDSDTIRIETATDLVGTTTVSFGLGNRNDDITLCDSGTYPLPPEPFSNITAV